MPFYQNPFTSDFEGNWLLADRHHIPKFVVPGNRGRGEELVTVHAEAPYNLSGNDGDGDSKAVLNIEFAINDFRNWASLSVTISASSLAATTAAEVVSSLNNNAEFSAWFTASMVDKFPSGKDRIVIKQRKDATSMRFYIKNNQAETVLLFNKKAGVSEIPTYFDRHTIANRFTFPEGENKLIFLDVDASVVDAAVVDNAVNAKGVSLGFNSGAAVDDYALLEGRSGLYIFQKNTVDGSSRITQTIEYHAGAKTGDLARKTNYTYSGGNTSPTNVTSVPYVLESGDLITPP